MKLKAEMTREEFEKWCVALGYKLNYDDFFKK